MGGQFDNVVGNKLGLNMYRHNPALALRQKVHDLIIVVANDYLILINNNYYC